MGIQGLLPLLDSVMKPIHISAFANQKVAIDGYAWLHRGATSCAAELCLGLDTSKLIDFFMSRIALLKHHKVIPVVVLDGRNLPSKQATETARAA